MKGFRRDFRRRVNRPCRLNAVLSRTRGGRGLPKLPPSGEDAAREAHGLRSGIRTGIIFVGFPGKFLGKIPGIFPVFIPETDFLFSPRFRRACRVRTYFEYKRMVSMGKPVRNLLRVFPVFLSRRFPEVCYGTVGSIRFESPAKVPPEIFPGKQYPDRLPRRLTVSRDRDGMNAHPCAGKSPAGVFVREKAFPLVRGSGGSESDDPSTRGFDSSIGKVPSGLRQIRRPRRM